MWYFALEFPTDHFFTGRGKWYFALQFFADHFFSALSLSIELSILLWNYLPIIKKREVGRGGTNENRVFTENDTHAPFLPQKGGPRNSSSLICRCFALELPTDHWRRGRVFCFPPLSSHWSTPKILTNESKVGGRKISFPYVDDR